MFRFVLATGVAVADTTGGQLPPQPKRSSTTRLPSMSDRYRSLFGPWCIAVIATPGAEPPGVRSQPKASPGQAPLRNAGAEGCWNAHSRVHSRSPKKYAPRVGAIGGTGGERATHGGVPVGLEAVTGQPVVRPPIQRALQVGGRVGVLLVAGRLGGGVRRVVVAEVERAFPARPAEVLAPDETSISSREFHPTSPM